LLFLYFQKIPVLVGHRDAEFLPQRGGGFFIAHHADSRLTCLMQDRRSKSRDFNAKAEQKGRKGKTRLKLLTKKRITVMMIYVFQFIL